MTIDALTLARDLIRCPSVTPADAGAQDVLAVALARLGFAVTRLTFGEGPDGPIANLFATIGQGAPHFAFAGHTDVVPTGNGWSVDPFTAAVVEVGPSPPAQAEPVEAGSRSALQPGFDTLSLSGGGSQILIGRGAADMKGSIAAFVSAAERHVSRKRPRHPVADHHWR